MLNREECDNALTRLLRPYFAKVDVQNVYHDINRGHSIEDDSNLLTLLIMEYFDNPPLKFEEIKENDFIFDKKTKERAKVRETRNTDGEKYIIFFQGYRCWDFYIKKYEPNRFYRKEVQDD